jgi:hypothetical protein
MATQKQRRRRAKEHRHEYDVVYVDDEGNEVEVDEELDPKTRKPPAKASGRSSGKAPAKAQPRGRGGRPVQPPSWPRVLKRGAIFAPIFLATVMLLGGGKMTIQAAILQTALLIAVFIPFSYFMDRLVWRQYQKRLAKGG